MNVRKNYGRRKADRWRMAVGLALGAVLMAYGMYTGACSGGGGPEVSGPSTVAATPAPVAAAPTVVPTAQPVNQEPVAENPGWRVVCEAGGKMTVHYDGEASQAEVYTYYTGFDGPTPFAELWSILARGTSVDRAFPACSQGDAEPRHGRPAGHCYFDKEGKPFTDPKSPKVAECRTVPCDSESEKSWVEDPKYVDGEWGSCQPQDNGTSEAGGTACSKKKTRTWTSTNICTKKTRTRTVWVYESCECPCIETKEPRQFGGSPSWDEKILEGKCEAEVGALDLGDAEELEAETLTVKNCRQVGTQQVTTDWLCQDDTKSTRNLCRNVVCPPAPCVAPAVGTTKTQLSGGADAECAAFGNFKSSAKQELWPWDFNPGYLFLICKAGTDHIVEPVGKFDTKCSNGKDISHVTACVCK